MEEACPTKSERSEDVVGGDGRRETEEACPTKSERSEDVVGEDGREHCEGVMRIRDRELFINSGEMQCSGHTTILMYGNWRSISSQISM